MTTPGERRRNLIWGREALEELAADEVLPSDFRADAAELLFDYPARARLQEADADDIQVLQREFIRVLSATRSYFLRVRGHSSSTEQRQYSLLVVLRHFI